MAVQKLGQQKKSIELAAPNVELTWKIDDEFIKRAKAYAQLMHEKKQIRELPNFDQFITTKFMYRPHRGSILSENVTALPDTAQQAGSEAPRCRRRRQLFDRLRAVVLGVGFPIVLVILWHRSSC